MAVKESEVKDEQIRTEVREHYGKIAEKFNPEGAAGCCGPSENTCGCEADDGSAAISLLSRIYETDEVATLPEDVTGLSLGCGDPVTLATLKSGQTVLDLGSGGGIDCFLAAKQVGSTGHVIGVDMTASMVEKARSNKAKMDAENVEFRLGEIEHLPVENEEVDVVISNCVINLSPDKSQVFREAYRVLKPGGRLAVSDIVTGGPLPQEVKDNLSAWAGCVSGALEVNDYIQAIKDAGFVDVELTPVYWDEDVVDEAARQLGVEIVENASDGSSAHAINLEDGAVIRIELGDGGGDNLTAIQRAVFSAKVTAFKPSH